MCRAVGGRAPEDEGRRRGRVGPGLATVGAVHGRALLVEGPRGAAGGPKHRRRRRRRSGSSTRARRRVRSAYRTRGCGSGGLLLEPEALDTLTTPRRA